MQLLAPSSTSLYNTTPEHQVFSGRQWRMAALAMERNILGEQQDHSGWQVGLKSSRESWWTGWGETKGSPGPGCWHSEGVTSPWAKLLKWGRKVRLLAGGCRG